MPIDKRIDSDGITTRRVMRITGPRPFTAEEQAVAAAHNARLGFEASIPAIEKVALDARTRDFDRIRTYASHGWYAQQALSLITRARQARDAGRIDEALWAAVLLGHYLTEAAAKGWPLVIQGLAVKEGSLRGGTARGTRVTKAADILRHEIDARASQYRRSHPYDAERCNKGHLTAYLARQKYLAEHLTEKTGQPHQGRSFSPDTIRKHLDRLHIS